MIKIHLKILWLLCREQYKQRLSWASIKKQGCCNSSGGNSWWLSCIHNTKDEEMWTDPIVN
jgi:hypothetical protein